MAKDKKSIKAKKTAKHLKQGKKLQKTTPLTRAVNPYSYT